MIRTSSSHSICVRKKITNKTALEKTAPESNKQSGERRFASPAPPILQTHRKKVTNQFVFQSSSNKNTEHTKPISFFFQEKKKKNPTSCQEYALITTFFFYIYLYIIIITNAKTFIPKFNIGSIATTQWMFGFQNNFCCCFIWKHSTEFSL